MTTSTKRLLKGFTLIELLTVIAIIGILAAIIIPTVGKVRETAQRSVASSNLRQVGQASLIYASDNRDRLPSSTAAATTGTGGTPGLEGVAFQLAYQGGLNDATIWFAGADDATGQSTVMNSSRTGLLTAFANATTISYAYMAGLTAGDPSTTPVAWTRGLGTDGKWTSSTLPWGNNGGHIVFLGGNVSWYRDTTGSNQLISSNGNQTVNVSDTRPRSATLNPIFAKP